MHTFYHPPALNPRYSGWKTGLDLVFERKKNIVLNWNQQKPSLKVHYPCMLVSRTSVLASTWSTEPWERSWGRARRLSHSEVWFCSWSNNINIIPAAVAISSGFVSISSVSICSWNNCSLCNCTFARPHMNRNRIRNMKLVLSCRQTRTYLVECLERDF